ncbi:MAG TPA: pyrroline-5-carboxylate reductase, partial [Lachnospiraceae bacterium]|nr:pyrroline-5-carboxylate reductase [Lachnospiraceae bacterium]
MKLAFIGAGNMAQAMIGGVLRKGLLPKNEIIATAATQKTIDTVAAQYGVNVTLDNKEAAKADIIVLAVKPVYYAEVIAEIKDVVSSEQIIVTIAAGKSVAWVEEAFGGSHKIVRTMPNTPALVGEGITAVCPNANVGEEDLKQVCDILESFGKAEVISEKIMDAVIAVSGSSPAYVFLFIEAMADAAVAE